MLAIATDNRGIKTSNSVTITINLQPTTSITNPVAGAVFVAPYSGTLQAVAADTDGSITNVQFFNGANLLGEDVTSPYTLNVNNGALTSTQAGGNIY